MATSSAEKVPAQAPQVIRRGADLRETVRRAQQEGQCVGLVPTMGALHDGHLQMIDACARACDVTVVTIFVNPKQFGPGEDWNRYPRDLDRDLHLLSQRRVEIVFAPSTKEMFRQGHETFVDPGGMADTMEGDMRPTHFRGVATVVLKLFQLAPADVAYFGRKDYQQTLVIRQLIQDFDVPIKMRVFPTVREQDGLAMSSRNQMLTPAQRQQARSIPASLQLAQSLIDNGMVDASAIAQEIRSHLESAGASVDYVSLVRDGSVEPVSAVLGKTVLAVAARFGATRLIDNCLLIPPGQEHADERRSLGADG